MHQQSLRIRYVSGTCSNQNCSTCQWENNTEMECIFCCSSSQVPAKTDHLCNYWLISLLSVVSKLLERSCVCIPGWERLGLWHPFTPGESTITSILSTLHDILQLLEHGIDATFTFFWSKKRLLIVFLSCKKKKKEDSLVWCNMSFSGWHPI